MDRREFMAAAAAMGAAAVAPGAAGAEDLEARARELVGAMTLDEKVAQMSGRITAGPEQAAGYGRYTTFNTRPNERLGLPGIRFVDGPKGCNFEGATGFPVAIARGAAWEPELAERVGRAMGYEARALGANFFGGVCINVIRHPAGGRSQETFGEDPHHLGRMGAATVTGLQDYVMACAKHYACNNNEDSRFYVNVHIDERALREIYLPHFQACVDAGVASVMSAYNDVNGQLCGHNRHLLTEILKDEWGFAGFVMSDFSKGVEGTVEAALAGLDVEMPWTLYYGARLKTAVRSGRVPESVIDAAVVRIVRQQLRFLSHENDALDRGKVAGPEHQALARETAVKSMTLLKNDNHVLPFELDKLKSLAVIGKLAEFGNLGDNGSSVTRPPYVITPRAGIEELAGDRVKVTYNDGVDADAAARVAAGADAAVVVVGLTYEDEGEGGKSPRLHFPPGNGGGDRERLGLHPEDEDLIKAVAAANGRCVVVLEGGSAITLSAWKDAAPAIVMAWYPGMEGGRAIAQVLFGEESPGGRLPLSWPKAESDLPAFDRLAPELTYDFYHGYRYCDKHGIEPEFPFGFGLSYTKFAYSNLRVATDRIGPDGGTEVMVDVTNTGSRAGDEVVQVYAGYPNSQVERPVKDLKGFARVGLAPGETRTVTVPLKVRDLAYYDPGRGWTVEAMEYEVLAGPSARESDLLRARFTVTG